MACIVDHMEILTSVFLLHSQMWLQSQRIKHEQNCYHGNVSHET